MATGWWRWSLTPLTSFDGSLDNAFDLSATGNTFEYNGNGDQNILQEAYQNLILSSSGNKTTTATLDINEDLEIRDDAVLEGTDNITLAGNWSAADALSFAEGTRTVTFDGGGIQSITNSSGEIFHNLVLNTSAAANSVELQNNVTINNQLTLTRGGIDLNENSLTLTNSATGAITRTNGYIISETTAFPYSRVIWNAGTATGTYTIPFATSTGNLVQVSLNKSTAGTQSGTGAFSVATYSTPGNNTPFPNTVTSLENGGADNSANTVNRFWMIDVNGYSTLPQASQSLTFLAAEADGGGPDRAAQRWNGTNWDTGVGANTGNTITIPDAVLNASSVWTIASTTVPLPIVLAYYKAELRGDKVISTWKTSQEINNHFFTVQKTTDFEIFYDVGQLEGQGNTQREHSYSFTDDSPFTGKSYYRLKQTDFDGRFSYSDPVMINYEGPAFPVLKAFPNPSQGSNIKIEVTGVKEISEIPLVIYNQQGQKVFEKILTANGQGIIKDELVFNKTLQPGLYILKTGKTLALTRKVIVN